MSARAGEKTGQAGQGTCLGYRFAHMREILERIRDSERLRFCFDTQHAFAAGYDLRAAEGYARTFAEFDELSGCATWR